MNTQKKDPAQEPTQEAPKPGTLAGERDTFLAHLKATRGTSDATIYTYAKDLDIVEAFFKSEKELSKILPLQITNFLKSDVFLKKPNGNPRAEPTKNKTARVLRMFLTWAVETGHLVKLPIPKNAQMGGKSILQQEAAQKEREAKAKARAEKKEREKEANRKARKDAAAKKKALKQKEDKAAKATEMDGGEPPATPETDEGNV